MSLTSKDQFQPLLNQSSKVFGPDDYDHEETRSFVQRTFGEMGEGSIRGSIFTICSIAIGAGALSIPYVIATLGWALGFAMVSVAALTSVWSLKTIVKMANRV